jgi:hypothetical protein
MKPPGIEKSNSSRLRWLAIAGENISVFGNSEK